MIVEVGSFLYFVFLFVCVGLTVGLYFLLRNKTDKTKKIVLFSILAFNFLLHFSRVFYMNTADFLCAVSFNNICATSVVFFPFIFLSKSDTWKDYMVYIGMLSGAATMLYPEGVLGSDMTYFDNWRFYICHMLLFVVSCLIVVLKVHKLNYHRIWKMPFCFLFMYLIIMVNTVLTSELGLSTPRGTDLQVPYNNESLVWYPDRLAGSILSVFVPDFLKYVPFGEHAGEAKYWPFLWIVCPVFIAAFVGCFLLSLPFEWRHVKEDFVNLKAKFQKNKE